MKTPMPEIITRLKQLGDAASPAPWGVQNQETECGYPCTPNGCCGHDSGVIDTLSGPVVDIGVRDHGADIFEALDTYAGEGMGDIPMDSLGIPTTSNDKEIWAKYDENRQKVLNENIFRWNADMELIVILRNNLPEIIEALEKNHG